MTIELIVFIAAILFGVLLYWRESNGNDLYRFVNKIVNSKELQMKQDDRTGFVFQQKFLLRLVYITFLFLGFIVIVKFLIPIGYSYNTVSTFASSVVGTVLGTYLANFVLKSGKIVDEKSESLTELVSGTFEKGKEMIDDMTSKNDVDKVEDVVEEAPKPEAPKAEKSVRERLKDKGLL